MVWTEKQRKVCCGSKWNSKEELKLSMDSKDDVQAAGLVALFRFLGEESVFLRACYCRLNVTSISFECDPEVTNMQKKSSFNDVYVTQSVSTTKIRRTITDKSVRENIQTRSESGFCDGLSRCKGCSVCIMECLIAKSESTVVG